jgi:CheY-like chemotaxis protein
MLGIARLAHLDSSDPLVKKRMELLESTGTHLLGLVTDLIDVSRAGSEQMRIQRLAFNMSTEVQRVAEIYEVRAAEKGLAFALESQLAPETWMLGDPARMRQVLHNLLGNAIKFTKSGSVGLKVSQGGVDGLLHFEVRDTGIGISNEDQKTIFNAFEQVSSQDASARHEGTGLGLTIASEIARLLSGSIIVRSTPGIGSVFTFSAQFESAPRPTHQIASSAQRAVHPSPGVCGRILLVEDNDVNALIASSMLTNQGHLVERVCDGAEAVHRALREIDRFDLVLMDCMMPNMDGFQATRSIRSQETAMGPRRVPIVALSAIIDSDVRERAIQSGMDDALSKPFTNDELAAVIRPWLIQSRVEHDRVPAWQPRELI